MNDRELLESCHAMLLQLTMQRQPKRQSAPTEFTPPSMEDVRHYCNHAKLEIDPVFFYTYFQNTNWVDANGKKVKNWKNKALTWSAQKAAKKQVGSSTLARDVDMLSVAAGM